jgi:hypothetical protein
MARTSVRKRTLPIFANSPPWRQGNLPHPPHDRLFWRMAGGQASAVREGSWKLLRMKGKPDQLFDLAADVGETKNLAAENPEIAERLRARIAAWDKELIDPVFPGSSVKNEDWGPGGANQKKNAQVKKPKRDDGK